jgi:sulfide:quinone oxidoreductase
MAHLVVSGAGFGGMPMTYAMKALARKEDRVPVVGNGPTFRGVASNPWAAMRWRERRDIEFLAAAHLDGKGVAVDPRGAKRGHPDKDFVEPGDCTMLAHDCLVVATGTKRAFEATEGRGPKGHTQSIGHVDHAGAVAGPAEPRGAERRT